MTTVGDRPDRPEADPATDLSAPAPADAAARDHGTLLRVLALALLARGLLSLADAVASVWRSSSDIVARRACTSSGVTP